MSIINLKTVLIADAITCTGVLALGLFALEPVATLLGLPVAIVSVGAWICLAAALPMFLSAGQRTPNPPLVKLIALGNLGWVAVSLAVVASFAGQMTGPGIAIVIAQAFGVLLFAVFEWKMAGGQRLAAA